MSKISELSDGGSLVSSDYLIAVRSGGNVKVRMDQINVDQIDLGDNEFIRLGNSQDLTIVHNASNSIINQAGIGDLLIQKAGSTKLTVNSSGIDVTGTIASGVITAKSSGNTDSALIVQQAGSTDGWGLIPDNTNGNLDITRIGGGTAGTHLSVTNAGNVGIGTDSPTLASAWGRVLHVQSAGAGSMIRLADSTSGTSGEVGLLMGQYSGSTYLINRDSGNMYFWTGGAERMRVDASGNLLVGKTSPNSSLAGVQILPEGDVGVTRDGSHALLLNRLTSDGDIALFRKDGTSVGSIGSNNGARLGLGTSSTGIKFYEGNSIDPCNPASTFADRDGAIDLGRSDNRFKDLYLSGKIAKGTLGELDLRSDGGGFNYKQNLDVATAGCTFTGQSTRGDMAAIRLYQTATGADGGYIRFDTCNSGSTTLTEKARLDSAGNLLVSCTAKEQEGVTIYGSGANGLYSATTSTSAYWITNLGLTSATGTLFSFYNNATNCGNVTITSTNVTNYTSVSDQRLKENIADADDAGSKIDAIQVRKFDWKSGGEHQDYGFIAQELLEVAPVAVSVPEDPEEMMSVDPAKLVPMMLKEIQSLRARVAQLES